MPIRWRWNGHVDAIVLFKTQSSLYPLGKFYRDSLKEVIDLTCSCEPALV
jgi:hypothetical protein